MKRGPPKNMQVSYNNQQPINQQVQGSSPSLSPKNRHSPYGSTSLSPENVPNQQPINHQIVDLYFDIVSIGCPVLQRTTMLGICSKQPQENSQAEEVAMLYAIQANCYQRLGRKEEGKEAFRMSRKYLSDVFDLLDNFHIAAAFLHLSLYCLGEGEHNQSKYYLNSVQFFINQNKERLRDNDSFVNLSKLVLYVQLLLEEEEALTALDIEIQKESQGLQQNLVITERYTLQVYHFKKMIDLFLFVTQNVSDGLCGKSIPQAPPVSPNDIVKTHLVMANTQAMQFNRYHLENSPAAKSITKLMHLLIIDGLRLGILSRSPAQSDEAIIETANRITGYTTLSYFPYLPSHIYNVINNAARIHLALYKQIQRGERPDNGIDYYDILKKDQRALLLLSERYSMVEKRAKPILQQLSEEILKRERQVVHMQHMFSGNTGHVSAANLPAYFPEDREALQRIEQITSQNPSLTQLPPFPETMQKDDPFAAVIEDGFDFDIFSNVPQTENFYTDPQLQLL